MKMRKLIAQSSDVGSANPGANSAAGLPARDGDASRSAEADAGAGSPAASAAESSSGSTVPRMKGACQPQRRSRGTATRPPKVVPKMMAIVTTAATCSRRRAGAWSDARAIEVGIAPPRPSAVTKRIAVSAGIEVTNTVSNDIAPKKATLDAITRRCPKRAAQAPQQR